MSNGGAPAADEGILATPVRFSGRLRLMSVDNRRTCESGGMFDACGIGTKMAIINSRTDWEKLLLAWLHDPPDKALDIFSHEARALRYLDRAVGHPVERAGLKGLHDQLASAFERLPVPTAGPNGIRAAGPGPDGIAVRHPLSASLHSLRVAADPAAVERTIADIADGLGSPRLRFLALWRLLPERLAALAPGLERLPADTRCPDHTIFNHMDLAAGLSRCLEGGAGGTAFLAFKLSPVQTFIRAARSTRDLLSGSQILAWITFRAILAVAGDLGPTALIYPALRGLPWMDLWLRESCGLAGKVGRPADLELVTPCLPNRFLAVVPVAEAPAIAESVREAARSAWLELAAAVRSWLDQRWAASYPDWARLWDAQVESFFDVRTTVLRESECSDSAFNEVFKGNQELTEVSASVRKVRKLATDIPENHRYKYGHENTGRWQMALSLSAALGEAAGAVRHVPDYHPEPPVPQKCTLLGTYEQMGPAKASESARFWDDAAKKTPENALKASERLCAVSLVKRFAFHAYFCPKLKVPLEVVRFDDTGTIAKGGWSKEQGPEPDYYAILAMDGDELGKWLSGANSPRVRDVLHPDLLRYFEGLPGTKDGLDAKRPVGPALHAAISEALSNFALHVVPQVVDKHHGTLIYAGGDDVLALLPVRTALECADELRRAYSGLPEANGGARPDSYRAGGRDLLVMGRTATVSAGIAVAHEKEDLRLALAAARAAEDSAKKQGRNRLGLSILRRSGEHASTVCEWDEVGLLQEQIKLYLQGASDRWAYQLRREEPALGALDPEAQRHEIGRLIARSESKPRMDTACVLGLMDRKADLERLAILCQSASFLARGREE